MRRNETPMLASIKSSINQGSTLNSMLACIEFRITGALCVLRLHFEQLKVPCSLLRRTENGVLNSMLNSGSIGPKIGQIPKSGPIEQDV